MLTVWLQTSCQPRAYGPWLVHFFTAFLQNHPHPCSDTGLQWGHCAWPWNSILPSDLRLLSVDLCMNNSEQRTEPQHEGLTLPQFSVSSIPPTESAFVSFMLSTLPLPPGPGPVAVMQLLFDLIYFSFMLNTIIRSHNGMSSALIVIIRLFLHFNSFGYEKKLLDSRVCFSLSDSIQSLWYLAYFIFLVV